MILACQNICKAFGSRELIKNASFHVEDREKAAIVGINGVGKSTLLKIIMKEMDADSGEVVIAKGKTIGYLAQHQDLAGENTIFDELFQVRQELLSMERRMRILEQEMKFATGDSLEEKMKSYANLSHEFELQNGYAYKSEVVGILKGLGFDESEFDKRITTLSGGVSRFHKCFQRTGCGEVGLLIHTDGQFPCCFQFLISFVDHLPWQILQCAVVIALTAGDTPAIQFPTTLAEHFFHRCLVRQRNLRQYQFHGIVQEYTVGPAFFHHDLTALYLRGIRRDVQQFQRLAIDAECMSASPHSAHRMLQRHLVQIMAIGHLVRSGK